MHEYKVGRKEASLVGIGLILLLIIIIGVSKYFSSPEKSSSFSDTQPVQIEAAEQKGYDRGYAKGYEAAKREAAAAYQEGYEAARKEIGSRAFTTYGIVGFIVGLMVSIGGFVAITRKTLSTQIKTFRKKYILKKAFNNIPPNLSPDVYATAEQIARAYTNITEQFHSAKGYTVSQYIEQWHPKLKELMGKAVRLMELIQELETARANVDEQKLDRTITDLRYTARRAKNDDTRNAAVKSLRRAKQTQNDLQKTNLNLENCNATLKGITGVLESMHLKISNIKVNTQKTELLEELSSDLEAEMSALEEALNEFTP